MTLVLGIDVGMSAARAAVVDRRGGLIAHGRSAFGERKTHHVSPRDWQAGVVSAVRDALHHGKPSTIDAIGIGALGPCPVLLDEEFEPVGDTPIFSTDISAETDRLAMLEQYGLAEHELGPDHVLPRLAYWQRTDSLRMRRARCVVDGAGYLVAWLTHQAVMDPATRHDHVARGISQLLPLPAAKSALSFAGGLTDEASEILGLRSGTPVTVGGYDSYVDLFGSGVRRDGEAGLLLGSTMVLGRVCATAPDAAAMAAHGLRVTPYIGEMSFAGGWTSSSGSLIDWADHLATGERSGFPLPLPGKHGLLALPYFAGERAPVWNPLARGAIIGTTLETTRAELHRALGEAVALSTLDVADRMVTAMGPIGRYRVAGGGVRNLVWVQDTADALGVPLDVVAHAGEAMGPAMLALAALGHDVEARVERSIEPDSRRHARYRELLDSYRRLYPALKDTIHALGRLAGKEET